MTYYHWLGEDDCSGPALTVKVKRMNGAFGGTAVVLCDEQGCALPDQMRCDLANPTLQEFGTVTAEFRIGGRVRLVA